MNRRAPQLRSSPRKRGPRVTERGLWIPSISASTRVFDALCAGMNGMGRRAFITLIGGAAAAAAVWPPAARAQQERMRRIGVLVPAAADDPVWQARLAAFYQGLALSGWTIGRNVRVDVRWGTPNSAEIRRHAEELAALAPDVILAGGTSSVGPLLQATHTAALASEASDQRGDSKMRAPDTRPEPGSSARAVPIVFTIANDPVGAGAVESLARPGGNATGFMSWEFSIGGKWLELLKQIAPGVARVAVLRDAAQGFAISTFPAMQAVAPSLGVEVIPVNMRDAGEIERSIETFARSANGGLIPSPSAAAVRHRDLILTLAARHKLPAVYWERFFVAAGGLISYGPDMIDQFRQAAGYVDRILKGEKPADLPVQAPTKYELVINLKSAKAIGLDVPPTVLARADEVIE
jgi:putative tryptophan/tyrosine transport system substrate-binding protein